MNLYYKKKSDKGSGELQVEYVYNKFLKLMITKLGVKSTYDYQLDEIGKLLFGSLFMGVYPMDDFKLKLKNNQCCILNTGLHWVAVMYPTISKAWL